jgi:DNA-binding NarL/FixJ family response regulator
MAGNDGIMDVMGKVRVLLADDHAVVRAGLRNALQGMPDLEIVGEVGDGPALLAALDATQPDLLLIDVTMPDFEPVAAIRQIRVRYPAMKILVVSAYDDDVYVQGLLGAGVNGYHLKDQPLSDLRLAVQRVLDGERWISSPLIEKLLSHPDAYAPPFPLTGRQREILCLLQQGLDNQSIALDLGLSIKTVENHLTRIYRQLKVQSRLEAVSYTIEHPEVLRAPGPVVAIAPRSTGVAPRSTGAAQRSTGAVASVPDSLAPDGVTMLLVDDNARYRSQLRRMVSRVCPPAIIYEAQDTAEAVHLAGDTEFGLVFIDVILGVEDGIRCARRIKALLPEARIVLISAYPDREFRRLGMEAGAAAFLDKKDLDAATMGQMIDDVLA